MGQLPDEASAAAVRNPGIERGRSAGRCQSRSAEETTARAIRVHGCPLPGFILFRHVRSPQSTIECFGAASLARIAPDPYGPPENSSAACATTEVRTADQIAYNGRVTTLLKSNASICAASGMP